MSETAVIHGTPQALAVEVIGITKRFGDFTALDNVSMRVSAGTVHALLGENGAGKSTLVKCIMGYHQPEEGSVLVAGKEQALPSPRAAHALGLGMVYQHFTLIPAMTVLENLVMSRAEVPAVINWPDERKALDRFLQTVPFEVRLDTKVSELAAGEKQKVEILKQLYLNSRFVILDEPTSVLTPQEADEILGFVRDLAKVARLSILIITHKFREVMAYADEVTILRSGRWVGSGRVGELEPEEMARMMVGDEAIVESRARLERPAGSVQMEINNLTVEGDSGQTVVDNASLGLRAGEIVGIAGVSGNGQSELVQVLAGQRTAVGGGVIVHGEAFQATRRQMRDHKIFCLPEEPLRNACVGDMSVAENMAFRTFDLPAYSIGGWWLRAGAFANAARGLIDRYNVKTPGPDAEIRQLSGGNVQRAVLARELSGDVDILIAANPCFGLDFSAVADIHAQIIEARNNGAAVLLVSEDLDELLQMSDRIIVMSEGRFVFETPASAADRMVIGQHMAGH